MHSLHLVSWVEYSPKSRGTSFGYTGAATVAYSTMVPYYAGSFNDSFVGSTLADSGLSTSSTELLSHAWREGTKLQYDTTVRRWGAYCRQWKIDTFTPPIAAVVNFLTSLFEMGLGHGAVASARSALGNFVTVPGFPRLAEHLLVQKLLKGIANVRLPKPRYTRILPSSLRIWPLSTMVIWISNTCVGKPLPY